MKNYAELINRPFSSENIPPSLRRLHRFLKRGNWEEADRETDLLLLKFSQRTTIIVADQGQHHRLYLPEYELMVMDQLWMVNSQKKFGFSVQKSIWTQCGGEPGVFDRSVLQRFGDRVGWRKHGQWLDYKKIGYDISEFIGHLPTAIEHREYCEAILSTID